MSEAYDRLKARASARWTELHMKPWIRVSTGLLGMAAGARDTLGALRHDLAQAGIDATVSEVGSTGLCYAEPLVDVYVPAAPRVLYANVGPEHVPEIVERHIKAGHPVVELGLATVDSDHPGLPRRPRIEVGNVVGARLRKGQNMTFEPQRFERRAQDAERAGVGRCDAGPLDQRLGQRNRLDGGRRRWSGHGIDGRESMASRATAR